MKTITNIYSLQLVKEKDISYESIINIGNAGDIYNYCTDVLKMDKLPHESLYLLTLNTKLGITGVFEVTRGTLNESLVHAREIFQRAILNNSMAIVLIHNHPSGNATPSADDEKITLKITNAGELLGIPLIEHLIVGENEYYSFSAKRKSMI